MLVAPRIESDPDICGGRPCVKGTRLEVSIILEWLGEGKSFKDILEAFPFLTENDIKSVVNYARTVIGREELFSIEMAP